MAESKQAQSVLKAHEASMTCSKVNIAIFIVLDMCATLFAFCLLLTRRPSDDEQMLLFATMVTITCFLVAVLPSRVPALYGARIHRIMLFFLLIRTIAFITALALAVRYEWAVLLTAWLIFHVAYLIFSLSFYILSKRRKIDPNASMDTNPATTPIEDTGELSNGQTVV